MKHFLWIIRLNVIRETDNKLITENMRPIARALIIDEIRFWNNWLLKTWGNWSGNCIECNQKYYDAPRNSDESSNEIERFLAREYSWIIVDNKKTYFTPSINICFQNFQLFVFCNWQFFSRGSLEKKKHVREIEVTYSGNKPISRSYNFLYSSFVKILKDIQATLV